jgi:hypothetical protein
MSDHENDGLDWENIALAGALGAQGRCFHVVKFFYKISPAFSALTNSTTGRTWRS